jgi:hypothetical protein
MPVLIEDANSPPPQLGSYIVDVLSRTSVKGQVIEANTTAMVRHIKKAKLRLHKNDIGVAQSPASTLFPRLVEFIAEALKEPAPECNRPVQVRDVEFNMV